MPPEPLYFGAPTCHHRHASSPHVTATPHASAGLRLGPGSPEAGLAGLLAVGPWFGERKGDAGSQERLLEREQSCFPLELFLLGPIPCCFPVSKQFSLETERIPSRAFVPPKPL